MEQWPIKVPRHLAPGRRPVAVSPARCKIRLSTSMYPLTPKCIYIYIYMCVCVYIYIYTERERECVCVY